MLFDANRTIDWWLKQNFWRFLWVPVAVSIVISEIVVAAISRLLRGHVDGDYLLAGLVTSALVSLIVCAALFFLSARVERRLQHEYAFRQQVLESIPGVFYLLDETGRFLLWNRNLAEELAVSAADMPTAHALEFFDEHDRPRVEYAIREVFEKGSSSVEATLCGRDGRRLPYYLNGFRFLLDGRPALLGVGIDIAGRKLAEVELTDAKDRLALALDASSLAIWDFDIKTGIVYLDSRWATMTGGAPGVTVVSIRELLDALHPDDRERILAASRAAFKGERPKFEEEFRFRTPAGEWKWIKSSGKVAERDADGRAVRAIGTNLDSTELKLAEDKIHRLAYYDSLTGLPNRRLLLDRLTQALSQARRFRRALAIMFLDLDDFKQVNDTLGHQAGDELLIEVARRLSGCIRVGDTISRQGGDEFVIVLAEIGTPADAERVADKVLKALDRPFRLAGKELAVTVSIGISVYPVDGADDIHELMKKADIAMYAAKKAGCNRYRFFEAAGRDAAQPLSLS